jgi:hypothetical protein
MPSTPNAATSPPQQPIKLDVCGAPSLPAARAKARTFVKQIRADLTAVEDESRNAPFLNAVEADTVPVEQLAAVATEEYSIIRSNIQSFAYMAQRWDTPRGSHFFGDLAYESRERLGIRLPQASLPQCPCLETKALRAATAPATRVESTAAVAASSASAPLAAPLPTTTRRASPVVVQPRPLQTASQA